MMSEAQDRVDAVSSILKGIGDGLPEESAVDREYKKVYYVLSDLNQAFYEVHKAVLNENRGDPMPIEFGSLSKALAILITGIISSRADNRTCITHVLATTVIMIAEMEDILGIDILEKISQIDRSILDGASQRSGWSDGKPPKAGLN